MELDCRDCDAGLVEFLYGEFDERRSDAFEQHLRSCPKCAAAADQLRHTRSLFAHLEPVEPPPLAADDPIMAAAMAKAEEMAAQAARKPPIARESVLERLLSSLRGAALRPALGAAFMVLLVAGVSIFFLGDDDRAPIAGPEPEGALTPVPIAEVRTAEERSKSTPQPEIVRESLHEEAGETPRDESVVAQTTPEKPVTSTTTRPDGEETIRRAKARGNRETSARSGFAVSAANGDANRAVPSQPRHLSSSEGSPFVVEAQRLPEPRVPQAKQAAPGSPFPNRGERSNLAPVIPTPPLPSARGAEVYAQDDRQQQAPTPSAGAVSAPAQQPARVSTPGQSQYERGMQAYRSGQYQDAADELNRFVSSPSAPSHLLPSGIHHLALSQMRTGRTAAAARSYDQLLNRFPGYNRRAQVLLEAARAHSRLGNYARAQALLSQLAAIPGWASRAQSELARMQHRQSSQDGTLGPAEAASSAEEAADMPAAAEALEE